MKPKVITFILFLFFSFTSVAQNWMQFKSSDVVKDFQLHENYLWTISGSGLTRIDIDTEEKTNWNALNSDLIDYRYDELLVANDGIVWLAGGQDKLMKFDGTSWNEASFINGDSIWTIGDLQKSSDGKVWIYGYFDDPKLFHFENGIYQEVPTPDTTLFNYSGNLGIGSNSHIWIMLRNVNNNYSVLGEFTGTDWILHDLVSQGINYLPQNMHWVYDSQGNTYALIPTSTGSNFLKYDGTDWTFMNAPAGINDYNNSIKPMYIDDSDHIWIGLKNNTFIEYDGQDWTTHNLENIGLENGFPDGLLIDDNNKQWIIYHEDGDHASGAKKMILKTFDGLEVQTIDISNSDLSTNNVWRILIDDHNNKWLGSQDGLLKFDGINWVDFAPATSNDTDWEFLSGIDNLGNAWIQNYYDGIAKCDGTSFFNLNLIQQDGSPISIGYNLAVGKNGEVYNATGENEVIIFDNGEISYLDSMQYTYDFIQYLDYVGHVDVDSSGNIYTLGHALQKYEGDSWTEIPLWTQNPFGIHSFIIAPNQDIWVAAGYTSSTNGSNFQIYDGVSWESFSAPIKMWGYPRWDAQGNIWFNTIGQGLCKNIGNDWTCYNESNSPLIGETIDDFAIDKFNNVWIVLEKGGVMVFNENQIENIESENLFTLSGSIYQDFNQNEIKDTSDLSIGLQRVMMLPDSITTFSYEDGTYRFSVSPGDYEVEFLENTDWVIENSPSNYSVEVDTVSISDLDFRVGVFVSVFDQGKNLLELKVFPNPTSSQISLNTSSSNFEKFQYNILNAQGQIIQSGKIKSNETKNILLDKIPAGTYWIQVGNEKNIGTSRFVKI